MGRCRRSTRSRLCGCGSIEVLRVPMRLATPLRTAAGQHTQRDVLLVHVRADEAEGWAECAVEPEPGYCPRVHRRGGRSALRDHLGRPRGAGRSPVGDAVALGTGARTRCEGIRPGVARRWSWRCSTPSSAPPVARWRRWLGATATAVAAGRRPRPPRRHRRPPGRGRRGAGGRRGAAAGEDRARAVPPSRFGRCAPTSAPTSSCRPTPTAPSRRTTPSSTPSTTSGSPASSNRSHPTTSLGHARLAARLDTPICLDEPLTSLGGDRGGHRSSAPARSCASSPPGSAAGSPRARCTIAARSSGCRCGWAGCSRPVWAAPRTWRSRPCPTWRCLPTSIHAAASIPTSPTRGSPSTASWPCPPGPARAPHPPTEALASAEVVGAWTPVSDAARHHRRRPRRRRADRRRGGAHAERSVAHALGGARHRDRREVREPPVHRGLQGARCAQQAPHADARTSGAAGSSPCRPGNHAQAVARHATRLGIEATIVMPAHTPFVKVQRTEVLGARVVLHGADLAEATAEAERLAAEGRTFVHPYDDPAVIAGQGTVALELLEDHPELDALDGAHRRRRAPGRDGGGRAGAAARDHDRRRPERPVGIDGGRHHRAPPSRSAARRSPRASRCRWPARSPRRSCASSSTRSSPCTTRRWRRR